MRMVMNILRKFLGSSGGTGTRRRSTRTRSRSTRGGGGGLLSMVRRVLR